MSDAQYELHYSKRGYVGERNSLVERPGREDVLPDRPPQFNHVRGSYRLVSERAVQLNEAQLQSKFLDYLFYPELVPLDGAR